MAPDPSGRHFAPMMQRSALMPLLGIPLLGGLALPPGTLHAQEMAKDTAPLAIAPDRAPDPDFSFSVFTLGASSSDAPIAGPLPSQPLAAPTDETAPASAPTGECPQDGTSEAPCLAAAPRNDANEDEKEAGAPVHGRLFPLGGNAARARGYRIPEPWGLGMLVVWNRTDFDSHDLSAAVSKGSAPAADAAMADLPFVTTSRLAGDTRMLGFKADLWLFPGLDLFTSIGKVRGTNRIDVAIDLDAFVPFPFCRPAKPCGTLDLPIETKVDNTTVTVGTLLVYGNAHWFVLGSLAKTVSISSKERSDVKSTNLALRAGPRFHLTKDRYFAPYVGVNYFDLNTTVKGVVASDPVFDDGDEVYLRYQVDMKTRHPFALVTGFNFEISRHLSLQAELQASQTSTRILASTGVRF